MGKLGHQLTFLPWLSTGSGEAHRRGRFSTMRKTLVLAAAMLAVSVTSSFALKEIPLQVDRYDQEARAILDQGRSVAPGDTVCFGGNGSSDGIIVTGGVWDWEGTNNEAPQFFDDGDPVGNQFRDGWTFSDQTAKV